METNTWTEAKMKLLINLKIFHDYLKYNRRVLWFARLYY
jgi:hypothetical protein